MTKPVLHHVNLKTTRLTEMIDWYGKVTGMTVVHQAPVGAWLTNDAANHRIALLAFPWLSDDPAKEWHTGLHHTAFEFPTFGDLFDNYARLRDLAITPFICLDHGGTTSMYFHDPDENLVELQVDNFGDWAKSTEYAKTPEFAANPIGMFIDPVAVHEAYRSGRSHSELHAAMMAGQFLPDPVPVIGPPAPKGVSETRGSAHNGDG